MISLQDWQDETKRHNWLHSLERDEQVFIRAMTHTCVACPSCMDIKNLMERLWDIPEEVTIKPHGVTVLLNWYRDEEMYEAVKQYIETPNRLQLVRRFINKKPKADAQTIWDFVCKANTENART